MSNGKYGRHVPAFVLLLLAEEPAYGSMLLNKMNERLPYNNIDGAALYRALKDLLKMNAVTAYWDTTEPGPPKKWYKITPLGLEKLAEYNEDIQQRIKNLQFFLSHYKKMFVQEEK
ncbi:MULTISPECIES: PadR family transcriptional regulator [unclassified Carboxydocella]|uniref:PadR family transcriptional regulator n=1 Tax=unclassified Carboxydocella TaxID=2685367 RepID=UPI0009AE062E|nr:MULTISPECIES: PadR family transcriptional regulator [unclassified Carboxydocella]AVX31672.1 transcriptional regulator, PadR family [Carboxydocella thermautotrophica]GAW29286.1 PadR family transcriptional regulator [Carboxydocella sp. ULO1]GAW30762.1 PadR family transcriptional regulator [Carboxydocella sp. JDF658]